MFKIVDVNKNVLSKIVEYFYTGDIEITIADVTDLLLAATVLQIDCLIEKSYDIVHKSLCIENYDSFLQFSKHHGIVKLQEICHTFICDNFPNFLTTNEVSKLCVELLISIIKEDGCRAESEDMILDAVVKWLQSNSEGVTTEIVERLIDCVRFEHCTSQQCMTCWINVINFWLLQKCCCTGNVCCICVVRRQKNKEYKLPAETHGNIHRYDDSRLNN